MARQLVFLVIGAVAGAAAVYLAPGGAPPEAAVSGRDNRADSAPPQARNAPALAQATGSLYAAERLAARERAASVADPFALEAMIIDAAAGSVSAARDSELEALLARLAELDPERAVRFAESLDLPGRFLAPLYRAWAERDSSAAIAALGDAAPGAGQRAAALAVLEAIGNDADGITRVAAALPVADRFAFEADALSALAEHDLPGALAVAAVREGDSFKRALLVQIGEGAAQGDPIAALAAAEAIGDVSLRSGLTIGILNAWAALDPGGMLAHLETVDPNSIRAPAPFERLVLGDPEGVLERLDRLPASLRLGVQRAALMALAETDAVATLARLEGIPPGGARDQLLTAVAETYGRQDPNAALAWAASRSPPSQDLLNSVVTGIASADLSRAIDWVLRELESPSMTGLNPAQALSINPFSLRLRAGDLDLRRTAERLLATGDATLRSHASAVINVWSGTNAEEAVSFALGHLDRLTPTDLGLLAQQIAINAPDIATGTPALLPLEHRASWVAGVAFALAHSYPDRAIGYLSDHRGQPGYEQGVVAVVRQLASVDSPTAAALLATALPSQPIGNVAVELATAWGRRDPRAAAAWALGLEQAGPAGAVAAAWARDDSSAAEAWALSLPRGEVRDAGITGVLTARADTGEFNPALLNALSSEAARQQGASRVILQVGRRDQARARELMNAYLSDPELRRQTEQQLAQLARIAAAGGRMPALPNPVMPQGNLER